MPVKKGPKSGSRLHLSESFKLVISTVTNLYLRGYLRFSIPDDIEVVKVQDYSMYEPPRMQLFILATNQEWHIDRGKIVQQVFLWMEKEEFSPWKVISAHFLYAPVNKKAPSRIELLVHGAELSKWPSTVTLSKPHTRRSRKSMVLFTEEIRPGKNWRSIGKPQRPVDKKTYEQAREHFGTWLASFVPSNISSEIFAEYPYFRVAYDEPTGEVFIHSRRELLCSTKGGK